MHIVEEIVTKLIHSYYYSLVPISGLNHVH